MAERHLDHFVILAKYKTNMATYTPGSHEPRTSFILKEVQPQEKGQKGLQVTTILETDSSREQGFDGAG